MGIVLARCNEHTDPTTLKQRSEADALRRVKALCGTKTEVVLAAAAAAAGQELKVDCMHASILFGLIQVHKRYKVTH